MPEGARGTMSRAMTVGWTVVLFVLAMLSRHGGHVVDLALSIASVLWGGMLGVFLLGTLTRRATERGTMLGMIAGVAVNLLLWLQPHSLQYSLGGHVIVLPKVAWTWWVLIGSLITCAVGYTASLLFPDSETSLRRSTRNAPEF